MDHWAEHRRLFKTHQILLNFFWNWSSFLVCFCSRAYFGLQSYVVLWFIAQKSLSFRFMWHFLNKVFSNSMLLLSSSTTMRKQICVRSTPNSVFLQNFHFSAFCLWKFLLSKVLIELFLLLFIRDQKIYWDFWYLS